ncbi:MAG: DDE-type integrase/transposase/recombinase [Candidatus Methanofastidiosum sp.]|nr:DDE-type integrase/transposase/recombinase [Methanofastidiosum sp.]
MKLDDEKAKTIVMRVVDYKLPTKLVAKQFGVSQRRVQQIVKEYERTNDMPKINRSGRYPYGVYPANLRREIQNVWEVTRSGAPAIAKYIRKKRGTPIDNMLVNRMLREMGISVENPNKRVRKKDWIRFERTYPLSTVHMDWSTGVNGTSVCVVLDDASRKILSGGEFKRQSAEIAISLLKEAFHKYEHVMKFHEVITDRGSEFYANRRDKCGNASHSFEEFCKSYDIKHILCRRAHPQTNGKVEKWFHLYKRHRSGFESFEMFVHWYNEIRPHMSLDWDNLETPEKAFWRKLEPVVLGNFMELVDKEEEKSSFDNRRNF